MEEIGLLITKTYGIAGLIMLSPFAALIFLWKHYTSTIKAKDAVIKELSDKRVDDAQKITDRLIDITSSTREFNKETNMALERVGDLMSAVVSQKSG